MTNALHIAIAENKILDIQQLMASSPQLINELDESGDTPLHIAVRLKYANGVRLLLTGNANTDIRNTTGDLPLHLAVRANDKEITQLLIGHDHRHNQLSITLNMCDKKEMTAMELAILKNFTVIIALLYAPYKKHHLPDHQSLTPLQFAAARAIPHPLAATRTLLQLGADIDEVKPTPIELAHSVKRENMNDFISLLNECKKPEPESEPQRCRIL